MPSHPDQLHGDDSSFGEKNLERPLTILVVDDDAGVRGMLKVALSEFGFAVRLAADCAQAIDIYRSDIIDLVLLDVQMPGIDGPATLTALRAIDPDVAYVFMSADLGIHRLDELSNQDPVGFLAKPFRLAELKQRILNWSYKHRRP